MKKQKFSSQRIKPPEGAYGSRKVGLMPKHTNDTGDLPPDDRPSIPMVSSDAWHHNIRINMIKTPIWPLGLWMLSSLNRSFGDIFPISTSRRSIASNACSNTWLRCAHRGTCLRIIGPLMKIMQQFSPDMGTLR